MEIKESNFDTVDARLEAHKSWKDHLPNFLSRGVELDPSTTFVLLDKTWIP